MRHGMIRRAWMPLACLLAAAGAPRSAHAEGDFERSLRAAVRLYESLEYEQALEQLYKAQWQARGTAQQVSVCLHEGIFLGDMGQRDQSRAAFWKGLMLDPTAKLSLKTSPKVERDFEEVRAGVVADLVRQLQERTERERKSSPPLRGSGDRPELSAPPNLNPPQTKWPVEEWSAEGPKRSRVPVASLVLGGVGVVSAGVGTAFMLQSRSSAMKVNEAYADGRLPKSTDVEHVDGLRDDAQVRARTAILLFGTAAVAVGSGVLIWLLGSDHKGVAPMGER